MRPSSVSGMDSKLPEKPIIAVMGVFISCVSAPSSSSRRRAVSSKSAIFCSTVSAMWSNARASSPTSSSAEILTRSSYAPHAILSEICANFRSGASVFRSISGSSTPHSSRQPSRDSCAARVKSFIC